MHTVERLPPNSERGQWMEFPTFVHTRFGWEKSQLVEPQLERKSVDSITCVTWNVLLDGVSNRAAALLETLEKTAADIICLQEAYHFFSLFSLSLSLSCFPGTADSRSLAQVTSEFLEFLLEARWVKKEYYVSDCEAGILCQPYGQAIIR